LRIFKQGGNKVSDTSAKNSKEERAKSIINAGLGVAATDTVQRYGSAVKVHLVTYDGVDNETGKNLSRSLKGISKSKVNSDHKDANLKQQAGFSAELKDTARENAEREILGKKSNGNKVARTDDIGRVNDPLFDIVELDSKGNVVPGSGTQMKFVGKDPKAALDKMKSKQYDKYWENDAKVSVPSDYYDGMIKEADAQIQKLKEQAAKLEAQGKGDLANQALEKAKKLEKIKKSLKKSKVSNKEAMEARTNPLASTAKDVAKLAHRAGMEQAKTGAAIGGGLSFIRNAVEVIKGEKSAEDAIVDVAKDTGSAAIVSYATGSGGAALKGAMQNAPSEYLRVLSKTGLPAQAVVVTLEIGKTITKYFTGEIDGIECLEELGEKGTGMLASAAGAAVGQILIPIPIVGSLIGGMIGYAFSSSCYSMLLTTGKEAKLAREERIRIEAECAVAIKQIEEYHTLLKAIIDSYLTEHRAVFDEALYELNRGLELGDADSFIGGANMISEKLGGKPQFNNMEEFDALMTNGITLRL